MLGATLIQKEQIKELKFPGKEVLKNSDDIKARNVELQRATTIGNAHHGKIKLIFEDNEGLKEVETTVWDASDGYVTLKGGVIIPVHCIHQVVIY